MTVLVNDVVYVSLDYARACVIFALVIGALIMWVVRERTIKRLNRELEREKQMYY